jgi:hypothetical protein
MSLPISTLTGSNTIAQLIYNVNRIKTLAANTASTVANSTFQSALANTNSYIATKVNTTTFNSALANTNSYIATKANIIGPTFTNFAYITGSTPSLSVGDSATSTGSALIEIGYGRIANGNAYIDLVGGTSYPDYGLRFIRSGETYSQISHRGTGSLYITAFDAASVVFQTNNLDRGYFSSTGDFILKATGSSNITHTFSYNENGGEIRLSDNLGTFRTLLDVRESTTRLLHFGTGNMQIGIASVGSGVVQFLKAGGLEAMRIDASGNLGIGTTTATNLLDVFTTPSAGGSEGLTVRDGTRSFQFGQTGSTYSYNGIGANENLIYALGNTMRFLADGQAIAFNAGTAERMRITSAGLVGIGTSSPTRTLDVNGYVQIGSTAEGRLGIGEKLSTGAAHIQMGEGRSGSGYAYIDLIGDTTYNDYGIRILRGNSGPNTISHIYHRGTGNFGFVAEDAAPIIFYTNNTERMRITAAGKVGIGTSNPLSALHVNGSVSLNQSYEAYLVNAYYDGAWKYLGNGVAWGIGNNFNGAANSLTLATAAVNAGGAAAALTWVPALSISVAGASTFSGDVGVRGAPGTTFGTNTWGPELQAVGGQGIASLRASGDAFGGALNLAAARGTFGSPSIVLNNDALGAVYFDGFDGGDYLSYGASIVAYVDGTPGVNDMPTRLVFSTSADGSNTPTERVRITAAGNVGIGGTPAEKLDVTGNIRIRSGQIHSHTGEVLAFGVNGGTEVGRFNSSGNFGIGTTSPSGELDVTRSKAGAVTNLLVRNPDNTGGAAVRVHSQSDTHQAVLGITDAGGGGRVGTLSNDYFYFITNNTERMRLDISGNFGIGTTTIDNFGGGHKTLELAGSTTSEGGVFKTATSDSAGAGSAGIEMLMYTNSSGGTIAVTTVDPLLFHTSSTERMRITSAGLMGLGTSSPGNLLTINGGVGTTSGGGVLGIRQKGDTSDDGITISSSFANSTRLWVDSGGTFSIQSTFTNSNSLALTKEGRVGVGTTSPVTTLDVAGTARATQGTPYTTYTANTKTLALTDNGYYTRCSNTTLITITIPNNSTVAFPLGSEMIFFQAGSGNVLFASAAGVTLNSKESLVNLTGQYSAATLKKIATNTWDLIGDLA